jgi:hypothetical protein
VQLLGLAAPAVVPAIPVDPEDMEESMARTVAARRGDFGPRDPDGPSSYPGHEVVAPQVPPRAYPVDGPLSQEDVIQWFMTNEKWPRWRAVAATAIAIAMRAHAEPVSGGMVIVRVVPGGFEMERRT